MSNKEILEKVNGALSNIDIQNQIAIARQEGFNQGYKACLQEVKTLLEKDNEQKGQVKKN